MLQVKCSECNKKTTVPSLQTLLELKGENPYPFIYYIDCCENKKVKIVLDDSNGIIAYLEDK